jgi:paraquat-inducible protein B
MLTVVLVLVGCNGQDARKTADDAATELRTAREAAAAEARRSIAASEEALTELRGWMDGVDSAAREEYEQALDEAQQTLDRAKTAWDQAGDASDDARQKLVDETERATDEVRRATRRVKDLTGDVKDDFVREADLVLEEIDEEIERIETGLANRGDQLDEQAKRTYRKTLAELRQERDRTKDALERARSATGDAWRDIRHDVNRRLLEIKASLETAQDDLKGD